MSMYNDVKKHQNINNYLHDRCVAVFCEFHLQWQENINTQYRIYMYTYPLLMNSLQVNK